MAHKIGDRILDTTTSTSTGNITVSGTPVAGHQTLSAVLSTNGDTGDFVIAAGSQWEVTRLTRVSANEYSRATTLGTGFQASSTGSPIDFSAGTKEVFSDIGAFLARQLNTIEIAVASASTCDIGALHGLCVEITGTTTITSLGSVPNQWRLIRFSGALILTHDATSLILPGGANITTAAGDTALARSDASGNWRVRDYTRADGFGIIASPTAAQQASERSKISAVLKGHIFGLTLSNNGSDATNDIDIAAGEAASTETNPVLMVLASALTKRLDASWAVGSGNGGLDTGSIANATYHVWLIRRSDTGVVDALFSTSATAPTMPTNYDQKRRIGAIIRSGGAILAFTQKSGDWFYLTTPKADGDVTIGASRNLCSVTAPPNAIAMLRCSMYHVTINTIVTIQPTWETDAAASGGAGATPGATFANQVSNVNIPNHIDIHLDASAQFAAISTAATTQFRWVTRGWIDRRGKDA